MVIQSIKLAPWQTGNHLFVYAFCWLLAKQLGYQADLQPVPGFLATDQPVKGICVETDPITLRDIGDTPCRDDFETIVQMCHGHQVNVYGHMEQSCFYVPHQAALKQLFATAPRDVPRHRTVIHIRGKDGRDNSEFKVSADYHNRALDLVGRQGAVIVTDDPDWQECKELNLPIQCSNPLSDFLTVASAENIVIGKSTFAWWAAFLSSAKTVVQPEPLRSWRCRKNIANYLRVPFWNQLEIP